MNPHYIERPFKSLNFLFILQPLETLPEEEKALIDEMRREAAGRDMAEGAGDEGALMLMSTMNDEGVVDVKNAACERLLQVRAIGHGVHYPRRLFQTVVKELGSM